MGGRGKRRRRGLVDSRLGLFHEQMDPKQRSPTELTLDVDFATQRADDVVANGQPESRANPRRLGTEEGIKDPIEQFGGDAGTGVGYLDHHSVCPASCH